VNDLLLTSLRRIRAVTGADADDLERRLLDILVEATGCRRATLRIVPTSEPAAAQAAGSLELTFPLPDARVARLTLEPSECDVELAEVVGGAVVARLELLRATHDATSARRQLDLIQAVTHAGSEFLHVSELYERAVHAVLAAFSGAHIAMHVLVGDTLELVARHIDGEPTRLEAAPMWLRALPLDDDALQSRAARAKQILTRPLDQLAERAQLVLGPLGVRHLLVAPLLAGGHVMGTLSIAHRDASPWSADSLRRLEAAATQIGVALAHVRRLEDARRRADDLEQIAALGTLVGQQLDLDVVLGLAVEHLARIARVPRVHLMLVDESRTMLFAAACNQETAKLLSLPIQADSAAGTAFRTRAPVLLSDARTDPRVWREVADRVGARSVMALPLIARDEPIGSIVLVDTERHRTFTAQEVARATTVANLLAPAIMNAKMFADLRRSYEALARAQADLVTHERLAALGELSAVVAHEVRNPLAVIFNSLGSLRKLAIPTPDAKVLLDIVAEEAARLNRIVSDLLDFAKPYASHPRPALLDAILRGAVEGARRAAPESSVEVHVRRGEGSTDLVVDATMLQQALGNLILNAIQASPAGGSVEVRVELEADASRLRFDVVDQGPGVDAAEVARIFQPFFTTKATGTGLGLAVVRRIADALGGTVRAARGEHGGSIFSLVVPLVAPGLDEPARPGDEARIK
jgi:signal transduction histidine kinase